MIALVFCCCKQCQALSYLFSDNIVIPNMTLCCIRAIVVKIVTATASYEEKKIKKVFGFLLYYHLSLNICVFCYLKPHNDAILVT